MADTKSAARAAQSSTAFRVIARIGYAVLGVLHILIGVIAITIATGGQGKADPAGAMQQIRETPAGTLLLWVIAAALTALAAWQIAAAVLERNPDAKKKWASRTKCAGTALTYLAFAGTAVVSALGGASGSTASSQSLSAQLMAVPAGVILVGVIGLIIGGVGVAFIVRGCTRAFEKTLDLPAGKAGKGIVTFGVVGYVAKGIAVGVTSVLFVIAAWNHDPQAAGGLDAGLHSLLELPFGSAVLWLVGAGLVIYGLFCFARARFARM